MAHPEQSPEQSDDVLMIDAEYTDGEMADAQRQEAELAAAILTCLHEYQKEARRQMNEMDGQNILAV